MRCIPKAHPSKRAKKNGGAIKNIKRMPKICAIRKSSRPEYTLSREYFTSAGEFACVCETRARIGQGGVAGLGIYFATA